MLTGVVFFVVMYNRVAQPQVVEILKVAAEVGKIDINQLFDE